MISVWAPHATSVRLRRLTPARVPISEHDLTPAPDEEGWWSADVAMAEGERYGFLLDGRDDLRPDPRSRRQPHGVHGSSALFDASRFEWTDADWTGRQLAGAVIYELHVGTFTPEGTLDALIGRLDHLVDLGITHIELLPVNAFSGTWNWGYDGVLWYTVHEAYGGPAGYQRFVDAAHRRGLAVIQDVVYNHLGPSGNYLPEFGPYLRTGEQTSWGDSVNLDERAVREYIIENALMWLRDFHVDGLRLDAVHALHDEQTPHILRELSERVDALSAQLDRPLSLIAESDLNDPIMILPREAGGHGLTAQWSDDWHHAAHVALTGETAGYYADFAAPGALVKVTEHGFFHDGTFSSFRGRTHGYPLPAEVPAWRLVTFAQDHDQIGNRAAGDRLTATLSRARLDVAAVLTLTAPGTPMLFMGEEWGATTPWQFFTSHPEPELARATAEGRIGEFAKMGWDPALVPDPQDPATFDRSHLDWREPSAPEHAGLLDLYRRLIALRSQNPDLTDPDQTRTRATLATPDAAPGARAFRIDRGQTSVLVNLTAGDIAFDTAETDVVLLETMPSRRRAGQLVVASESAVIVERMR
ncbi:malto-oligosyltrehalose trehalohydrolase [Microbacterium sp. UFMG61]|uniref:malto-oligosyltrehalose trehalohydrolase n=1 Tax=Microbacterium sp. UFMG61 TaxID=2745935 RepID=UPI00188F0F13|nr:malto-oligosyltrehalose trehalohydrolase [Microbacterium sp. UFMG61]